MAAKHRAQGYRVQCAFGYAINRLASIWGSFFGYKSTRGIREFGCGRQFSAGSEYVWLQIYPIYVYFDGPAHGPGDRHGANGSNANVCFSRRLGRNLFSRRKNHCARDCHHIPFWIWGIGAICSQWQLAAMHLGGLNAVVTENIYRCGVRVRRLKAFNLGF